jgi:cell division septal protein FtsQ
MGRREALQLDLTIPEEEAAIEPAERAPARRGRTRADAPPAPGRSRLRRWTLVTAILLGALAVAAAGYQVDEYFASDSHFVLPGGLEDHPNLAVTGAVYAPQDRVAAVFARDFGRSVYLIPLAERRRALMSIDWIQDAAVERHWPNRVSVEIVERRPVAFAMLPRPSADGATFYEPALVDAEGVLLALPPRARFALPALYGVTRQIDAAGRRERVRQALGLMEEVKAYAGQISEINAADPHNLTATFTLEGRALRLMLGSEKYRDRLQGFLGRYTEISRRVPYARVFDLRLYPYITAQDGVQYGR